ncbi:PREDICTED: probable disease resistance protein RPP1 isoform X2 [Camelina sativa]|uniref:Probable disease resistance protein RPP1 isoform X2 n=1 Tax=Camelina sativa TaxID=90675 RepID=A0ABM1QS47_CAMSA|nr:PREDICTED: probable disease resistance protein RPP1 isoform X2 [Camelina sativa]
MDSSPFIIGAAAAKDKEIDSSSSSSLSPSSVPPSSSSQKWIHDVFLSFCGEDVRREFVSHILKEFQRQEITPPFIGSESKGGVFNGHELIIRAIRGSKIMIIVVSKDYASSKWHLDEMVEIMKCREESDQTVMVIFYKVDPSDLNKLTGDFGEVFLKTCVGESKEDTEKWRKALAKVAKIAGYCSRNCDNEAAMIEKFATNVKKELINYAPSSDFDVLETTKPFLDLESDDVNMIGIWGPSGIGKITKPCNDITEQQLHKEILPRSIINPEDVKIHHLGVGQDWLKDKKRVFIVLAGAYQPAELDAMANEAGLDGPESQIIITTQNKKLLNYHGISHMCEVGQSPDDEAFQKYFMNDPGQKSSSSSSVPLSSLPHNWTHNIFASFRGKDVREDFLSHIHKEFRRKGIKLFIDNEIKRGKSIGPELIGAIRKSTISIIFLSRNYASSKWCLNELVEIMKWREELYRPVIPIFYKIVPSDVKNLTGDFGKAFIKTCAGTSKEDIERWRQALAKVATIADCYDSSHWENDAAMIEQLASRVSDMMNLVPSRNFDNLVGMNAHIENLKRFLRPDDSRNVRIIGIWGPSGIGKSTIAKVLFGEYSQEFQLSAFMANVKTRYPIRSHDNIGHKLKLKMKLQVDFLSQIRNQQDIQIRHLGNVEERLRYKKVFVVIDDVDCLEQLDAITGLFSCYGPGSMIIATAQDLHLFKAKGIDQVYKVDFSTFFEAVQIFCIYAFGQRVTFDGFENIAMEITKLTGNLPLGLKVLGSFLRGMSLQEWKTHLPTLKINLNGDIENVLKFTYDVLSDKDKKIFLHIACFFNYEPIEKVEEHLASKFSDVRRNLKVLSEKSLISISSGYVKMHDLLEKLGRDIVRKQCCQDPGKRMFLVDSKDTCKVLSSDTIDNGTVLGINSKYSENMDELIRSGRAFGNMHNLHFLRLHGNDIHPRPYLPQSLTLIYREIFLPRGVRLLHWECFPMTCMPYPFTMESLIELNMSYSQLKKLWKGYYVIKNLKWMDLKCSKNLEELPDLSTAINLQELNLEDCSSLVELPSSLGSATNLKILNLSGCSNLEALPSSIGNAANIRELFLRSCSRLVKLPSSIGNITILKVLPSSIGNINLEKLYLNGCSVLEALPININMESLDVLDLAGCSMLKKFPEISTSIRVLILNGTAIEEVPSSIRSWSRLDDWHMSYSENLKKFPHAFDFITELHLSDTRIQEIAPWVKRISRLRVLVIKGCTKLVSLPELPDSLSFLNAENCESLERLHCSFHTIKFIGLNFVNCFKLNQEARDLIIKTSACRFSLFPGEKVPTYFTYLATGDSLSMKWNGIDKQHPRSLNFKAYVLLVNKGDTKVGGKMVGVSYCLKEKINGDNVNRRSRRYHHGSPLLKEHLYTFHVEEKVSSNEFSFEFEVYDKEWEIGECGLNLVPMISIERKEFVAELAAERKRRRRS